MQLKEFNKNSIETLKEKTPHIYKSVLHVTLPFFRAHKVLFDKGESVLKEEFNLTQSELDVISCLYYSSEEEHTLTPTKLYELMLFSSGGMTKLLKKLEEKELIKRVDSKEDKRVKNVQLTKKGIDIMLSAIDRIISFEDDYFNKLDNKEQKEFAKLLNKLLD
ncbi:MarR family winged helix-turn-helix transcriptional regulator [Arcobacter sp. YIC-464]|uniref:MarR family winged helix-turn-helix transcriptional regulator n=1 Tax=Arcobacter sp. YIC-464 TaxID=3376631 RepID=UPI003C23AA71